jgi:hypothetical protein
MICVVMTPFLCDGATAQDQTEVCPVPTGGTVTVLRRHGRTWSHRTSAALRVDNPLEGRAAAGPFGGRRLVPTRKHFGSIPFRTEARGRPGSPSIWRSVIGIEPSAIAGRPVLQILLRSQPRHAPNWRMTREANSRPACHVASPAPARSLPRMSSFYGTPGPIRTDTDWFLRPVPPTVGLLGQIFVSGPIRSRADPGS